MLYQHYLDEREIPYAVRKTTSEMMSMIQVRGCSTDVRLRLPFS